jgi:hypothetical protein
MNPSALFGRISTVALGTPFPARDPQEQEVILRCQPHSSALNRAASSSHAGDSDGGGVGKTVLLGAFVTVAIVVLSGVWMCCCRKNDLVAATGTNILTDQNKTPTKKNKHTQPAFKDKKTPTRDRGAKDTNTPPRRYILVCIPLTQVWYRSVLL